MSDSQISFLSSLSPDLTAIMTALISIAFSEELSLNDLNILGNLLTAIGSVMLTEAAQIQAQQAGGSQQLSSTNKNSSCSSSISNNKKEIQDLKKQIEELEKQVKKLNCRK